MGVFRNQTGKFCFNLKILTEDVAKEKCFSG